MARTVTCDACKASTPVGMTGRWKEVVIRALDDDLVEDEHARRFELCERCTKAVHAAIAERGEFANVSQG